ncbi:MAG: hypothetical protein NZM28_06150, partial [Fimbriimonadales bacterium]|nr:hypothetical protein [Fimbriimonadales bacterium]
PNNGDVLKWNGAVWAPAEDLRDEFWQASGSNIFYNTGNVGIGTNTMSARLHVATNANFAIYGDVAATSGSSWGVQGRTASNDGGGVYGFATAISGDTSGVYGVSRSPNGRGVYGFATASTGTNYGVFGKTNSSSGYAGYFEGRGYFSENVGIGVPSPNARLQVSTNAGSDAARIDHTGSGRGLQVQAVSDTAVWGVTQTGFSGVDGRGQTRGVYGLATSTGATAYGVHGESASTSGFGVYGRATAASGAPSGVYGESVSPSGRGVAGFGLGIGVAGSTSSTDGTGVFGFAISTTGTNYGLFGQTNSSSGYAGYFQGRVHVQGTLSKSAGSFKIDHPLDPENKYLVHSFVESPDMVNLYNGNATTDARGYAVVTLPEWFEALNTDFRYQLTVIGQFAQAIIAQEIRNNQFVIRTDKPHVKVSWQVTGIRKDPYAQQHRIQVEEWKLPEHRGKYLHPELYGQPKERGIHYHPAFDSPVELGKPH